VLDQVDGRLAPGSGRREPRRGGDGAAAVLQPAERDRRDLGDPECRQRRGVAGL